MAPPVTGGSSVRVTILQVADPLPLAAVPSPAGAEVLRGGLRTALREAGTDVRESRVSLGRPSDDPLRDAFDVAAEISRRVRAATEDGHLVIVLAGACLTALGACAGLRSEERRVVWLDAHADFNTPETTISGLLDGMALATLTGRCLAEQAGRIPDFRPVPESSVTLIGARDLDDAESQLLDGSSIQRWEGVMSRVQGDSGFFSGSGEVYVHLDLDVLDPSVGRANRLASPGGLPAEALETLFRSLGRSAPVRVVALTAYDPEEDQTGGAAAAAIRAVRALVAASQDAL